MEAMATSDSNTASTSDHPACVTSSIPSSSSRDTPLTLPSNLPLQPSAGDGGQKQRRSSCRPTFVTPVVYNIDDVDDDCAFQRDPAGGGDSGEGRRENGDLPGRRRHSVSFLPCRGSGSTASSVGGEDLDEDCMLEHRRLQRTPTPYYEEAPSLLSSDAVNVDDMEATESVEESMTDASGTTEGSTSQKAAGFSYDGDDDDDDDDEEDICRELAQLN